MNIKYRQLHPRLPFFPSHTVKFANKVKARRWSVVYYRSCDCCPCWSLGIQANGLAVRHSFGRGYATKHSTLCPGSGRQYFQPLNTKHNDRFRRLRHNLRRLERMKRHFHSSPYPFLNHFLHT